MFEPIQWGFKKIKSLNYKPVGLGEKNFSANWLRDNTGENISLKNKYYGEYTFHYWFWKNSLKNLTPNRWTGFCAYRRFWTRNENTLTIKNKNDLSFDSKISLDTNQILFEDIN